jgi:hypothetical protein
MMGHMKSRLSPVALGVGFGLACAIYMLIFAWAGWLGGYGKSMTDMWAAVYPGFDATFAGGIVGAVWGFAKGFIFGVLTACFYNMCLRCCSRCNCCNAGTCDTK